MDQLPDFMIADNPLIEGTSSAIIHTRTPQAIIEVIEVVEGREGAYKSPYRHYTLIGGDFGKVEYVLRAHHLFTTDFDGEKNHIITTEVLDKAWGWFVKYMKWQYRQEY